MKKNSSLLDRISKLESQVALLQEHSFAILKSAYGTNGYNSRLVKLEKELKYVLEDVNEKQR